MAVIAGITLEKSIEAIGKKGCTATKHLVNGLRKLGYECPNRCRKLKLPLPELAIAKMTHPGRKSGWHWVAIAEGRIYDGVFGREDGTINWPPGAKMTSYFPVTKKI